jgi:tetratricopeptide (TPR) repeat protein/class 3 adenylate cyclase
MLQSIDQQKVEIAHVLFMDIVGYSRLAMDEQRRVISELQQMVSGSPAFGRAQADDRLIRLPTGDGMALVFFDDPEAPVRCALEISQALRAHPEIGLRMGIHTGPVYRVADINANRNVAGGGINIAQRVMDCGDGGHILVSREAADVLGQISKWNSALHRLGEVEVKHGVRVQVFNLCTEEAGNPKLPGKLRKQRQLRWMKRMAAVAVCVVAIAATGLFWYFGYRKPRPAIAVLGFGDVSESESSQMSERLQVAVFTQLGGREDVRMIPIGDVAEAAREFGISKPQMINEDIRSKIHRRLGCDYIVLGSYTASAATGAERQIELNIQLQDAHSGQLKWMKQDMFAAGDQNAELRQLARTIRRAIGVADLSESELDAVSAANDDAANFYSDGQSELTRFDLTAARASFEKSIKKDPKFPLSHSGLSETLKLLGYDTQAKEEARLALELSQKLRDFQVTALRARYAVMASNWNDALKDYGSLVNVFPDDPEYRLSLARTEMEAGKGQEAFATLAEMRKLRGALGRDPRIPLLESEVAANVGDFKRQLQAAGEAANRANELGAKLLLARAEIFQCWAYNAMGDISKGVPLCEDARDIDARFGDKMGEARAINNIANAAYKAGDLEKAEQLFQQAFAIQNSIGSRKDISGALSNLANVQSDRGEAEVAKANYNKSITIAREIGFAKGIADGEMGLAGILLDRGELASAADVYRRLQDDTRVSGNPANLAMVTDNLGLVELRLGQVDAAEKHVRAAIGVVEQLNSRGETADYRSDLADIEITKGQLEDAQKTCEQALSDHRALGAGAAVGRNEVQLASILLEKNQFGEAESLASHAAETFQKEKDPTNESWARDTLIQALIAQGKMAEAEAELKRASDLAPRDAAVQLALEITTARIAARNRKAAQALQHFARVRQQARKLGLASYELEARLGASEAKLQGGNASDGQSELRTLQKEASLRGYGLIASKAERALNAH